MKTNSASVSARLKPGILRRLDRLSERCGLDRSLLVRAALEEKLPQWEKSGAVVFPNTDKKTTTAQTRRRFELAAKERKGTQRTGKKLNNVNQRINPRPSNQGRDAALRRPPTINRPPH
jgi:hypothetical protein